MPAPAPAAAPELAASARAAAAAAKLKGAVMAELSKAVAEKGAAGAIDVCGAASATARDSIVHPDLAIGRTSSKLRNPANTAPAWASAALATLEQAAPDQRKPVTVDLPGGGLGYVEPLVIAPLCMQCHGAALSAEVKAALAAKCPADQATGYAEGDLRRVVWVELKGAGG